MKLYIPIILGTGRESRNSEKAAKFMLAEAKKFAEVETEIIDVRYFLSEVTDNSGGPVRSQKFAAYAAKADGFIIVAPEYNHGYPGELKLVLDMLSKEYARKPVGICGVSTGMLGGARMVEQLRLVAIELRMIPIREAIYFSKARDLFDESGVIKDESYAARVEKFVSELLWYARVLKSGREAE